MFTIKLWVLRILVFLVLRCKIYYVWSRVYRWLYAGDTGKVALPTINNEAELTGILSKIKWKEDTWKELWDAVATPQMVWVGMTKDLPTGNDCDEFSVLATELLRPFIKGKQFVCNRGGSISILEVGMLSVPWTWPGGSNGHNVCMFSYNDGERIKWAYVGNWFGGAVRWSFDSCESVIADVLLTARKSGSSTLRPLGAAYADYKLKLIKWWPASSIE